MTFYHYTSSERLPAIIESGMIIPTESNVSMLTPHAGPDVVWLLDRQLTEFDASHGLTHGLDGSLYDKRSAFIEVDVPAVRWLDWPVTATMDHAWRDGLIDAGGGPDAAAHWYVWPTFIHRRHWLRTKVLR